MFQRRVHGCSTLLLCANFQNDHFYWILQFLVDDYYYSLLPMDSTLESRKTNHRLLYLLLKYLPSNLYSIPTPKTPPYPSHTKPSSAARPLPHQGSDSLKLLSISYLWAISLALSPVSIFLAQLLLAGDKVMWDLENPTQSTRLPLGCRWQTGHSIRIGIFASFSGSITVIT